MTDLGTDRIYVFSKDEDGEDEADFFGKSGGGPGQFKVGSEDTRAGGKIKLFARRKRTVKFNQNSEFV